MAHRLSITLPDDVYEKIKEQAERDMRTIGAEIAYQLKLHVPAYKKEEQPAQPTTIIQHHLSYPPGVRSPENPAGRPDIITTGSNPYARPYTEYCSDPDTQSTTRRKIIE